MIVQSLFSQALKQRKGGHQQSSPSTLVQDPVPRPHTTLSRFPDWYQPSSTGTTSHSTTSGNTIAVIDQWWNPFSLPGLCLELIVLSRRWAQCVLMQSGAGWAVPWQLSVRWETLSSWVRLTAASHLTNPLMAPWKSWGLSALSTAKTHAAAKTSLKKCVIWKLCVCYLLFR